jgi:hypothetical protein
VAENPASWGKAERVVSEAIRSARQAHAELVVGLSEVMQITNALRAAGLLKEEAEEEVVLPDGCKGGHSPDLVSCELGADWP